MSDWTESPLEALVSFQKGRKVQTSHEPRLGYERYLGASGILGLSDGFASTDGAVTAVEDDVLMLWDGERSGLVGHRQSGVVASTVSRLRPSGAVNSAYLYYALASQFDWVQNRRTGSGVPHVPKEIGRILRVRYPRDVLEQNRIAAILTSLDTAIESTEAQIEKHLQIRAGLLHDLFARGVALDGSIREPHARSRADGAVVDAVPAGWDVLPLQRCLTESASNGIYKPPHLIGSGALLVGQTAITEDRSVDPKLARRALVSAAEVRRFGVAAGDVLVARVFATVEGVGRPALVPDLGEPAVFESNMMRLRVAASVIRPRLLFEWLKSDASRRHIEGRANASNQVSVNQSVLYPLPVPIPPMEEQDRMVERIEAADRARAADLAVLEKLRMQKQGLMQDLLTGRVHVRAD